MAKVKVGSKNLEFLTQITDGIRTGRLSVIYNSHLSINCCCIFCHDKIENFIGEIREKKESHKDSIIERYRLCGKCYVNSLQDSN